MTPRHRVVKTYGHDLGLSCAFRQWRADSHCRHLHGYALAVRLEFGADSLDINGWVIDFGSMKPIKTFLEANFDHKLLVAADDPLLPQFRALAEAGGADIAVWPEGLGTERFAAVVHTWVTEWLAANSLSPRVTLLRTEVAEHAGNSAGVVS